MPGYDRVSYWLETAGDLMPRAPLDGSTDADVAILGAGFTGLWTAYYLLRADPALRVVVVEAEIAGFGASGRNGAWCTPGLAKGVPALASRYGAEAARATHAAMVETVGEIGRVLDEEGIDADFARDGELSIAIGEHERKSIEATLRSYEALGLGDFWTRLDARALADRLRVEGAVAGIHQAGTGVVHPGLLVRGLARAVEARGGVIHEQTRVAEVVPGRASVAPLLRTTRGDVKARVVVLAGESYLAALPGLHRQLLPVYSLVVLTEPLDDARLDEIGWTHRAVVNSQALAVDYLSRTADGRILFGGRGAPYHFGSRIRDDYDRHEPTHERLRAALVGWFPSLAGVRFTHAWGGPVAVPRDWMPTIGFDRRTGVATARGYVGEGVAASNLAGRVLADLVLGASTPITRLPVVGHRSRDWEPEPLRWLGARYVQWQTLRLDARARRTGRAPRGRTPAERLLDRARE